MARSPAGQFSVVGGLLGEEPLLPRGRLLGLPLRLRGLLLGASWMVFLAALLVLTCWAPILGRFGAAACT